MCSDLWDRGRQRRRDDQTGLRLTWTEEIDSSNILWLKVMQVSLLNHPKRKDWKREIETFTDEKGIIRKCQRYRRCSETYNLVKAKSLFDTSYSEALSSESGLKETLTELRSQVRGRHFIRNII